MEPTSIPRERSESTLADKASFKLGYFQSAVFDGAGTFIRWNAPGPAITSVASPIYRKGKFTKDQIYRGPLRLRFGGPFLSLAYALGYDPSQVVGSGTLYRLNPSNGRKDERYVGGFMPPTNSFFGSGFDFNNLGALLTETNVVIPSMTGLGDQAWRGSKPKLEAGAQFENLVELRELKGSIQSTQDFAHSIHEKARAFRDDYLEHVDRRRDRRLLNVISSEWLNANFGWLPFLKSTYELSQLAGGFANFVKKFTKLNGTPFRKRVPLEDGEPVETRLSRTNLAVNATSYAIPCFPQSFPAPYFVQPPHWELVESVRQRSWGVGKWTFYRPEFDPNLPGYDSAWNKFRQALIHSGLRITPTNLFNVIPWTWLLRWVTNVGNYVDELTDIWEDQIVNHYCFAMRSKETVRRLVVSLPFRDGARNLTFSRAIVSKQRQKGSSPFGFDLDASDLSVRQLSILAALKSSRRRSGIA